jgi:hypothetical protein
VVFLSLFRQLYQTDHNRCHAYIFQFFIQHILSYLMTSSRAKVILLL